MNIREVIREAWFSLTPGRRWVVVAIVALLAGLMVSGWVDSLRAWQQIRVFEREAAAAKRTAAEKIEAAAKIATEIRKREAELDKLEVKRNEKQKELDKAAGNVSRDRAEYDRAVRESRPDAPSTEQLCDELAALGYPCQQR